MNPGRRCVSGVLVLLLAVTCMAGELPNAPSAEQIAPVPAAIDLHLVTLRTIDAAEWMVQPIAVQPAPAKKRVFDKKFALLAGLAAGLTIADFELTQSCLRRRVCDEADPLMPTSRAGMYATNIPLNAALFWWSYRRKEDGKRLWWLAPLMVVGSHAAGVATNIRFIGEKPPKSAYPEPIRISTW